MSKAARPVRFRGKWRIRWLDHTGARQRAVFDSDREAQRELDARRAEVEQVRRGLRKATPEDRTFGTLCDHWLSTRALEKRSREDDASIIRRHLRPTSGNLPLRLVSTEKIEAFKASRRHLAAQTVRNHLTLLRTMLRLAVKLGWLVALVRTALASREIASKCTPEHAEPAENRGFDFS